MLLHRCRLHRYSSGSLLAYTGRRKYSVAAIDEIAKAKIHEADSAEINEDLVVAAVVDKVEVENQEQHEVVQQRVRYIIREEMTKDESGNMHFKRTRAQEEKWSSSSAAYSTVPTGYTFARETEVVQDGEVGPVTKKTKFEVNERKIEMLEIELRFKDEQSEKRDLQAQLEKEHLQAKIEKEHLQAKIEKHDLQAQIEKQDLQARIEKQDLQAQIEKKQAQIEKNDLQANLEKRCIEMQFKMDAIERDALKLEIEQMRTKSYGNQSAQRTKMAQSLYTRITTDNSTFYGKDVNVTAMILRTLLFDKDDDDKVKEICKAISQIKETDPTLYTLVRRPARVRIQAPLLYGQSESNSHHQQVGCIRAKLVATGIVGVTQRSIATTPPDLMDDELPSELRNLGNLVQTVWEPCVTYWPELKTHSGQWSEQNCRVSKGLVRTQHQLDVYEETWKREEYIELRTLRGILEHPQSLAKHNRGIRRVMDVLAERRSVLDGNSRKIWARLNSVYNRQCVTLYRLASCLYDGFQLDSDILQINNVIFGKK